MTRSHRLLALSLVVAVTPAVAQDAGNNVVLSDEYGHGMVIGTPADATAGLTPAMLSGQQIAAEFSRLCLTDPATVGTRIAASPWQFAPADAVFPASKKSPAVTVAQWRGPSTRVSTTTGDAAALAGLKGQPLSIRDRGVVITGGYGSYKAAGVQCNLDVNTTGLSDGQGLADALTAAIGQAPAKLVVKPGFADGYWQMPAANGATRRVGFSAVDFKKSNQPVHLTVQILSPKGKK